MAKSKAKTESSTKKQDPKAPRRRGIMPGDTVINRTGGGTPQERKITSSKKVDGIRRALLSKGAELLSEHKDDPMFDAMIERIETFIGLRKETIEFSDEFETIVMGAFVHAYEGCADAKFLADDALPGRNHELFSSLHKERPAAKSKPRRLQPPKVVGHRRIVAAMEPPMSQIEKALRNQPPTIVDKATHDDGFKRVLAATSRSHINA